MYTILKDKKTILRTADRAFIPAHESNADYRAFLKWQADGNVSKDEVDDPVVIGAAKDSKLDQDLLPTIIDAVQALLNDDKPKIQACKDIIDAAILRADVQSVVELHE